MKRLAHIPSILAYQPYLERSCDGTQPKRKGLSAPLDKGTFIKPVKQSFVKNPRTMPMTRIMVALLSGWSGGGEPIETTTGIIAKHLGRSRRHIFRLLQDAKEEGYLFYTKTKDRIGRYTGIKIFLNFAAIRFKPKPKTRRKSARILDVTQESETNRKHRYILPPDASFMERVAEICQRVGLDPPSYPA